jgi:hypothetical protein
MNRVGTLSGYEVLYELPCLHFSTSLVGTLGTNLALEPKCKLDPYPGKYY